MNIILNNRPETLEGDILTIRELLTVKKFSFKMIVVKINEKLIKKDAYETATIKDGDDVTVLHLISGG